MGRPKVASLGLDAWRKAFVASVGARSSAGSRTEERRPMEFKSS